MNTTTSRPIAVWVGLAILSAYIPFLFVIYLLLPRESVLDQPELTELAIAWVELFFWVLSLSISIWAIATRRSWGRLFVAIPPLYIIGNLAYSQLFFEWDPVEKADTLLGAIVGLSPLFLVILLVSFGSDVRNYVADSYLSGKEG